MKTASTLTTLVHNKLSSMVVTAGVIVGVTSSSWAASNLGASFIGRGADDSLLRSDSAGVVAQTFWNNVDSGVTFKGTSPSMLDSAGNFTDVRIVYDASDSWNSDGGTATPNDKLMKGIIKSNPDPDTAPINNSDRMLFVITNLPAGTYNVIVYAEENGANQGTASAQLNVTVGATTYYIEQEGAFSGSFIAASSTTPGAYVLANYAEFDGVSPAGNGTITITATKNIVNPQLNDGAGVAAIQLIQVSGGAYPPNTQPCSITSGPTPSSTLAVEGNQVNFTIGDSGPCKVQWTRNGVNIPGATSEILTFNAALADNNALYRAIVYNNVNTNVSSPALLQVDANTPPTFTQGFLKVEQWQNIGGGVGSGGIADLKTNIAGSGVTGRPPTTSYFVGGANVPQTSPNVDSFGDRIWGWVKPDVTGNYFFFIRSDDSSEFYINITPVAGTTNALPDVQVDAPSAFEYTCCRAFLEPPNGPTSGAFFLEAGNYYGIVMLLKEGGGNDMMQLAWRRDTDTTPAASLQPIPAANLFTMASPAGHRVSITSQPKSITVIQGRQGSFSVGISTTPSPGEFALQWLSNSVAIPGATAPTYTTPAVTLPMNGTVYAVRALTLFGNLLSSNAILTVIPDTNPPVPFAGAITRNDGVIEVGVSFDEAVDPSTLVAGNFTVLGAATTTFKLATNSFNTYQGVVLDTTGLSGGNTYTARVSNVKDVFNNAMPQTDARFTVGPARWAESGVPIRPGQVVPVGETGFDVLNGGRKEWDSYDEITLAYVKKTNDFDVEVQVVNAEPGSQWTRVGLHARNSLDAGVASSNGTGLGTHSAYAQTHVNPSQTIGSAGQWPPSDPVHPGNTTPNNSHEQNTRLTAGAATTGWQTLNNAGIPLYPDVWLRLQRVGTNITGYASSDGRNWVAQGVVSLTDQQADMYVGTSLAVETGNIWSTSPASGAPFDVWGPTDPGCTAGCAFDANYDRLWVAQFRNFIDVNSTQISIAIVGGVPRITFGGVLQRASVVTGPYTDVAGATSPYTPTGPAGFFRVRGTITSK
jgi:PA14 domain.